MAARQPSPSVPAEIARERLLAAIQAAAAVGVVVELVDDEVTLTAWRQVRQLPPIVRPLGDVLAVATLTGTRQLVKLGRGIFARSTAEDARSVALAAIALEAALLVRQNHRNVAIGFFDVRDSVRVDGAPDDPEAPTAPTDATDAPPTKDAAQA